MKLVQLFFPLFLILATCEAQQIINSRYRRSIYLASAVVREEHVIDIIVKDEMVQLSTDVPKEMAEELNRIWAPNYIFVIPPEQRDNLAYFDAAQIKKGDGNTTPIAFSEITADVSSCAQNGYRCYNINLPYQGGAEEHIAIVVTVSYLNQVSPKPAVQKDQSASLKLFYRSKDVHHPSLYETRASRAVIAITEASKTLKMRCPMGSRPEKNPERLPFDMKGFRCNGDNLRGPVDLHYEARDTIMIRLAKLERRYTYLPWNNQVQVSEYYEVVHDGFRLPQEPKFSRYDFMKQLHKSRGSLTGSQVTPKVVVIVPSEARGLQVRDEVGINWSEMDRRTIETGFDLVDVPLRFPLIGGMSAAFNFYYTINADALIKPFKAQASPFKKLLQIPLARIAIDIPVDYFKLTWNLPEDSDQIEYELGTSKAVKVSQRRYRTFFSTTGEKEISFEFRGITRDDLEKPVAILFNYPFWGVLRKPLVALLTVILLVWGVVAFNRAKFSLSADDKSGVKGRASTDAASKKILGGFFRKRRDLLQDYEDLIGSNVNAKAKGEQERADYELRDCLDNQLKSVEQRIFEKIKESAKDPQQSTLNSIILKKMYDDQLALCHKLLNEVISRSKSSVSVSSSGSTASVSGSVSMASIASIKLSRSGSADLLQSRSNNSTWETLAREAIQLDEQISQFEEKFPS